MKHPHFDHGVTSKAALFGHPLHPMVVPFPIAFFIGTLVSDIVFTVGGDPFWAEASKWLLVGGIGMSAVAATLGFIDFFSIRRARSAIGWMHMGGNATNAVLSLISLYFRWNDPVAGLISVGLVISIIVTAILLVTGWLGGELAYRYKIGVIEESPEFERSTRKLHPAE
jgi:uncharacterized membrane protein